MAGKQGASRDKVPDSRGRKRQMKKKQGALLSVDAARVSGKASLPRFFFFPALKKRGQPPTRGRHRVAVPSKPASLLGEPSPHLLLTSSSTSWPRLHCPPPHANHWAYNIRGRELWTASHPNVRHDRREASSIWCRSGAAHHVQQIWTAARGSPQCETLAPARRSRPANPGDVIVRSHLALPWESSTKRGAFCFVVAATAPHPWAGGHDTNRRTEGVLKLQLRRPFGTVVCVHCDVCFSSFLTMASLICV